MKIKWFCMMGMVIVMVSGMIRAQAADMNSFSQCTLVPLAHFDTSGRTTAVGLTSRLAGIVHWLFFDQNGLRLDYGSFQQEAGLASFVMSTDITPALSGVSGFLIFCLDSNEDLKINASDGAGLAANAFQIDLSVLDVAYLPGVPVFADDLDEDNITADVSQWLTDPIDNLSVGATRGSGEQISLQYLTDGVVDDGDETTIYIFSTSNPPAQISMDVMGPAADAIVNVALSQSRLNIIDVESIAGMNDAGLAGSGLLVWNITATTAVFAYSISRSPAFGASQTLLGNLFSGGGGDDDDDEEDDEEEPGDNEEEEPE